MILTAVWGSPGSGKTTLSLALAAAFARSKEDVLVIGTDACAPSLPVFLPANTNLNANHSIGSLLELPAVTEASLKDRIHQHPKSRHLFFMGHVSGEAAAIAYKPPERGAIVGLMHALQASPFRHVILDCAANPVYDPVTLFALEAADAVVRVITPDVRGCEFQKAQLGWLSGSDSFHVDSQIRVCDLAYPFSPVQEAAALSGGFAFTLPYSTQVAERTVAGELLSGFDELSALRFERSVDALAQRIRKEKDDV